MKIRCALLLVSLAWMLPPGCNVDVEHVAEPTARDANAGADAGADAQGNTAPTRFTEAANAAVAKSLPLADPQDFEDAQRGLVRERPEPGGAGRRGATRSGTPANYAFVSGRRAARA